MRIAGRLMYRCVFFFQAEDGIRDIGVTGVQTCALPILKNGGLGLEIYGRPLPVEIIHVVVKTRRTAAATDDNILEFGHLMEHVVLYSSKSLLANAVEQLLHRLPHAALDVPVEVVEGQSQIL